MTYLTVGHAPEFGLGNVEMLIGFCDLISPGPQKPYHTEFLLEYLFQKVQLWPVDLDSVEIDMMVRRAYIKALRKHRKLNPGGPLPNMIRYFPAFDTIRYRPKLTSTIVTLCLATGELLVQGYFPEKVLRYSRQAAEMSPLLCLQTNRVILPGEASNFSFSLGDVCNILQGHAMTL